MNRVNTDHSGLLAGFSEVPSTVFQDIPMYAKGTVESSQRELQYASHSGVQRLIL